MRSNVLTSLSVLATAAVAAPTLEARTADPWVIHGATGFYSGHGILSGAEFNLAVPAGYIPDAPAFDVHCQAYYDYSSSGGAIGTACSFNGPQAPYSSVTASLNYNTLVLSVRHQWLAPDNFRRVSIATGTAPARPPYDQSPLADFSVQVSDTVTKLPGLIGHFGQWSATDGDFVRDSVGRDRGMQYKLSAPAGYTLDAPGFSVSCYYDYNPDASVYPECTPIGSIAAGSKVALWASVLYNITTVHHEWTAANGTKFQLVGTSDPLPNLGQVTTFTISPDVLNTL